MKIQRKAAQPVSTEVDADEGVVIAVVSVTGTVDSVRDIIEPGAYTKTLAARRPKVVHSHDWNTPIGRVDEIKELLPGDPLLPKTQPNGDPWPSEAGALVVKARFNLETQRGRESFSDVKFYGTDGAWSIGYNVPIGGSTVESKTGIRRIKELELYEVSPVLHGAHAMAGTQLVKALAEHEADDSLHTVDVVDPAADEPVSATGLVCELCGGTEALPDSEICARCDGPMSAPDTSEDAEIVSEIEAIGAPAEEKALGHESLDEKPGKNWVEETGQLPAYIQHIAKDLHEERGMTMSHAIATAISKVKKWARGGDNVKPDTQAKATAALAEWEALKAKNAARTAADGKAAHVETETKWFRGVTGTVEERLDRIRIAVRDSLTPPAEPAEQMIASDSPASYGYVDIIGTYDDYVIASVYQDGGGDSSESVYRVPYTVGADGDVVIGMATEVDIQTVVVPKVEDLAVSAEKTLRAYEAKAGRVLSSSNATRLKAAVEELINVLQAAGVDLDDEQAEGKSLLTDADLLDFELIKLAI